MAARLSALAFASKAHWKYPAAWMAAWREELTIDVDLVRAEQVYAAMIGKEIVGFYVLIIRGADATLSHLWVDPQHIQQGIGSALFRHAAGVASEAGCRRILIESDPNAEAFYAAMGSKRVGARSSYFQGHTREVPLLQFDLQY